MKLFASRLRSRAALVVAARGGARGADRTPESHFPGGGRGNRRPARATGERRTNDRRAPRDGRNGAPPPSSPRPSRSRRSRSSPNDDDDDGKDGCEKHDHDNDGAPRRRRRRRRPETRPTRSSPCPASLAHGGVRHGSPPCAMPTKKWRGPPRRPPGPGSADGGRRRRRPRGAPTSTSTPPSPPPPPPPSPSAALTRQKIDGGRCAPLPPRFAPVSSRRAFLGRRRGGWKGRASEFRIDPSISIGKVADADGRRRAFFFFRHHAKK